MLAFRKLLNKPVMKLEIGLFCIRERKEGYIWSTTNKAVSSGLLRYAFCSILSLCIMTLKMEPSAHLLRCSTKTGAISISCVSLSRKNRDIQDYPFMYKSLKENDVQDLIGEW